MKSLNDYRLGLMLGGIVAVIVVGGGHAKAQSPVPPPDGLVNWWDGDAVSGTTAFDIWDGINGTMVGGVGLVPGMVGQAFSFDGVDDYVDLPEIRLSGPFTIDMWWSTESVRRHTLVGWGDEQDRDYLQFRNNIRYKYRFGGKETSVFLDYASDGTFYHVTLTRDSEGIVRLYHNGNLQDTVSINTSDFRISNIARNDDGWNIMNGLIDEVEIFSRALSDDEIWAIFNAGSAGKCKIVTVSIDIKPGSDPNPINPGSNGLVPVAILSSEDFDATTVDPTTVELAGARVAVRGEGKLMAHEDDVDGDGLLDLVVQVETQSFTDLGEGGMVALTGTTFSGEDIVGYDEVVIVPAAPDVKEIDLKFKGEGQFGMYPDGDSLVFFPYPGPDLLNVSHLGLSEVDWEIRVTQAFVFVDGWFTITGVSGDQLEGDYSGFVLDLGTGDYDLEWAFTDGTGRFAGAEGTGHTDGLANLLTGEAEFEFSGKVTVPE